MTQTPQNLNDFIGIQKYTAWLKFLLLIRINFLWLKGDKFIILQDK